MKSCDKTALCERRAGHWGICESGAGMFVPDMTYHSKSLRKQMRLDQPARDRQEQLDRIEGKLDTLLQQTKSRTIG